MGASSLVWEAWRAFMMKCNNCGYQNQEDTGTCGVCGQPMGQQSEFSLGQGMKHFGEEVERLGEKVGKEVEEANRAKMGIIDHSLGILGPLVSSLIGLLLLILFIWIATVPLVDVNWIHDIGEFFLNYLVFFFLVGIMLSYTAYLSRRYHREFRWVSPLLNALAAAVGFWVLVHIFDILYQDVQSPLFLDYMNIANFLITASFVFVLLFGYILLLLQVANEGFRNKPDPNSPAVLESKTGSVGKLLPNPETTSSSVKSGPYRSGRDKLIAGVCGGLAEYFSFNPTALRIIFLIAIPFTLGNVVIAYLVLWVVIPRNSRDIHLQAIPG